MYTQDINELTISGHVSKPPRSCGGPDDPTYEFVLTHSTHAYDRQGWEQHHYNITAYGTLGEAFADRHQSGQVILITGELDLQLQDTLVGELPYVTIIAHRIITVDGPLNPAASAGAPDSDVELLQTPTGPRPRTPASR